MSSFKNFFLVAIGISCTISSFVCAEEKIVIDQKAISEKNIDISDLERELRSYQRAKEISIKNLEDVRKELRLKKCDEPISWVKWLENIFFTCPCKSRVKARTIYQRELNLELFMEAVLLKKIQELKEEQKKGGT